MPFCMGRGLRERNARQNLIHQSRASLNATRLPLICTSGVRQESGIALEPTTSVLYVLCVCALLFTLFYNLIQAHVCSIQQRPNFFSRYSSGLRSPTIWDNASTIFLCIRLAKTLQLSTVFKRKKNKETTRNFYFLQPQSEGRRSCQIIWQKLLRTEPSRVVNRTSVAF